MSRKKSLLIILISIAISVVMILSSCLFVYKHNKDFNRFDDEYSDIEDINIDTNSMNVSLSNYKLVKLLGEHRIPEPINIYKDSLDNKVEYSQLAEDLTNYKVVMKTNEKGDVLYTTESGEPSFEELSLNVSIKENKLRIETNTGFNDWLYIDPSDDYKASGTYDSNNKSILAIYFKDGIGELAIDNPEQLNLVKICQTKIDSHLREFFFYKSLKVTQDESTIETSVIED